MATLIEYSAWPNDNNFAEKPKLTSIGYLTINPDQALENLLPKFYVANYLDIKVPSKSEFDNENQGLKISQVPNGMCSPRTYVLS